MLKLVIKTEKSNIRVNILKIEYYQLFDLLFPYKINWCAKSKENHGKKKSFSYLITDFSYVLI